jgi:hypothetical protein
VERLPRGEGEAVPVNRIEPWIVPHEPDLDAQENLGALTADPMRLRQILLNLLSNACSLPKKARSGRQAHCECRTPPPLATLRARSASSSRCSAVRRRRVRLDIEAVAHAFHVGIPGEIAVIGLNLDLPRALQNLEVGRRDAEAVSHEAFRPFP